MRYLYKLQYPFFTADETIDPAARSLHCIALNQSPRLHMLSERNPNLPDSLSIQLFLCSCYFEPILKAMYSHSLSLSLSVHYIIHPALLLFSDQTLQQKNTCAHNNTRKAHANGIKKAKRHVHVSTKGMDPKFLRNQKFAKKYNGKKRVHSDE